MASGHHWIFIRVTTFAFRQSSRCLIMGHGIQWNGTTDARERRLFLRRNRLSTDLLSKRAHFDLIVGIGHRVILARSTRLVSGLILPMPQRAKFPQTQTVAALPLARRALDPSGLVWSARQILAFESPEGMPAFSHG